MYNNSKQSENSKQEVQIMFTITINSVYAAPYTETHSTLGQAKTAIKELLLNMVYGETIILTAPNGTVLQRRTR